MGTELEERIKARAFDLWLQQGRPTGRHLEHWESAKRLLAAESRGRFGVYRETTSRAIE